MHFVILQANSIWTTTTTILLQINYDSNPPNFIQKFQNGVLAGIMSSSWCASSGYIETSHKLLDQSLNHRPYVIPGTPLTPLHLAKSQRQGLVPCTVAI
jgi:hypothetical protein